MSRHINLHRHSVRLTGAAVFIATAAPAMAAEEPAFEPFGDDVQPFDSAPVFAPAQTFESVFDVSAPAADASADVDAKLMQSSMTEVLGNPVSDEELGEMRGKFVSPQNISFFGISMVTSWQDQSGVTTQASLAFNVDFLKDSGGGSPGSPQVLVNYVRGDGDCADLDVTGHSDGYVALEANPQEVLPIGALDTLNGAGQVNVIAGKNNETGNNMRIEVIPRSMLPAVNSQGTPLTSSMNLTFGDGDQLQFKVGQNEVGLVMTGNGGLDTTLQSVGGDLGYLLQQTTLNSDSNHIMNNASVMFGVDDTATQALDRVSADGAMMAMKGFGF